MLRNLRVGALFFLAGGFVACDSTPSYTALGKEPTCKERCEELHDCDSEVLVSTCTEDCTNNEAISRDGDEVITACVKEQQCDASTTVQLIDCIDDGLGALPPSPEGETFCAEALDEFAKCRGAELKEADRADCLDGVSVLTDELVTDLSDCARTKDSCDAKNLCALAVGSDLFPSGSMGSNDQVLKDLLAGLLGAVGGGSE